jgi:hypothetical protein
MPQTKLDLRQILQGKGAYGVIMDMTKKQGKVARIKEMSWTAHANNFKQAAIAKAREVARDKAQSKGQSVGHR